MALAEQWIDNSHWHYKRFLQDDPAALARQRMSWRNCRLEGMKRFFRVEAGWAFSVDCYTYHILKKGNESSSPLAPIGLLVNQMDSMKENSKLFASV